AADKDGLDRSTAAGVLEELGQFGEAEAQLKKFVDASKRPEDQLTLANYLIRRKRLPDALDVCDGAWTNGPPVAVAEICLVVLALNPSDEMAIDRVAKRIEAAQAKSPEDPQLLTALAALRNFQGRFDDAEALYRTILKKDVRQPTALNNLAWLLALKGKHAKD